MVENVGLKAVTKELKMAAQKQCLPTRNHKTNIIKNGLNLI